MTKITETFEIQGSVPFCDVDVEIDSRMFVDLHAIRLSQGLDFWKAQALSQADSFLSKIVSGIRDESFGLVRDLLTFPEPWYTRMGLTRNGFLGNGGSQGVADLILDGFVNDRRMLEIVGLLRRLDQLQFFVAGVGADITSDITTRVILDALIAFTHEMMQRYPQLRRETRLETITSWSVLEQDWVTSKVELPMAGGRALVLVPESWARRNPLSEATRFHDVTVLGYVQQREARFNSQTNRIETEPKKSLSLRDDLSQIVDSNIRVVLESASQGRNLLDDFDGYISQWVSDRRRRAA